MKGYQYRWFVIDPDSGRIEYYEKEDHKRSLKPRGALSLIIATLSGTSESSNHVDSQTTGSQVPNSSKSSYLQSNEVNHTSDQSTNGNFPIAE
ncbi:unnamed protein product [Schistosoma mattheei]|uniref:Uncharacterized protein n=1 Tax=Schistosoma mattheei TaxID=31246 RepID=A0A183PHY7_9TREM|nr:unnamed protein product [Schistosoma mattheei]